MSYDAQYEAGIKCLQNSQDSVTTCIPYCRPCCVLDALPAVHTAFMAGLLKNVDISEMHKSKKCKCILDEWCWVAACNSEQHRSTLPALYAYFALHMMHGPLYFVNALMMTQVTDLETWLSLAV